MNRELAAVEWRRTANSMGAAEVRLHSGYPEDAVSRRYYTVLQAASAVHARGDTASHAAVSGMFGLHLVRSGETAMGGRARSDNGRPTDGRLQRICALLR